MNKSNENEESSSNCGTDSSINPTIILAEKKFNSLKFNSSIPGYHKNHGSIDDIWNIQNIDDMTDELWEDIGVVDYLNNQIGGVNDDSTEEERVEALKEVLQDTDIIEGDGDLSDFLFHIARTKHGKIYIRVIRTLLLNRGKFELKKHTNNTQFKEKYLFLSNFINFNV